MSDERDELRAVVRRFLAERLPMTEVRRLMAGGAGWEPDTWSRLAGDLGLAGLAVPERFGGAGGGPAELAVVFEEMGAALAGAPLFSTAGLAVPALLATGDEAALAELLPAVAAGERTAALAFVEDDGRWDAALPVTRAGSTGGGWRLDGHKSFVVDGHTAGLLLVTARTDPGRQGLFAVDADAAGLTRTPLSTLDPTRKLARLELAGTPARLVGAVDGGRAALDAALAQGALALAAEQVGGLAECLRRAVEHASTRVQFGRPIGSFQAVKHRCADMLVDLEGARSVLWHATGVAVSGDPDELALATGVAQAHCSAAYFRGAADALQIFGGIGFTWEHDAHLFYKRAKSAELFLGDADFHREALADRLEV